MSNPFQAAGAQPSKQTKYAPIFTNRFFTGLWTQRNPLRDAASTYLNEKFYSGNRYDSLIDGENVEITNRLTLARRPGLSVYNDQDFPAINRFYDFRIITAGSEQIIILADTSTDVYNATGPSTKTSIFTKSGGSGQTYFQGVGGTLYMGNGVDQVAWTGSGATRNWGIAGPATAPEFAYPIWLPNFPYTFSYFILDSNGNLQIITTPGTSAVGNPTWSIDIEGFGTTTENPTGNGVGYVTIAAGGAGYTVGDIITISGGGANATFVVLAVNAGAVTSIGRTLSGTNYIGFTLATGSGYTAAAGVATTGGTGAGLTVDTFQDRPVWTNNGPPETSILPEFKSTYAYSYKNSVSGQYSTASPTILVVHTDGVPIELSGARSTDPQVDTVVIWRTLKGGSLLLFLDEIPNPAVGDWSYTDTTADADLNQFITAPINGANDPPPEGLINLAYHLGRIFGSVGNTVYYSGGPSTVTGLGSESFPPTNTFTYPSEVRRIWPMALGALVFTASDIYIILGQGTVDSPLYTVPFLSGIGLYSYNAFDRNGSIAYLLTTDRTNVSLDPNTGFSEIGFPIGDLIEDSTEEEDVYIAWHNGGSRDKALYLAIAAGTQFGAGFANAETPSGPIDDVNFAFTLANTPAPAASLRLYLNGVLQTGGGVDYTLSGAVIIFNSALSIGDTLQAFYRVSAPGSFVDATVPTGAINGINVTYTLPSAPNQALSLMLFKNGIVQTPGGVDYTLAGSTITYVVAPDTGDSLICWYRTGAPTGLVNAEVPTGAINGTNVTFTTTGEPGDTLELFLNGVEQRVGVDYNLVSNVITFVSAPQTNDTLISWYRVRESSGSGSGWFRMNQTAAPEEGLNWSPFASINQSPDPALAGCSAVQSLEVEPGIHKLLVGPFSNGPILMRNLDVKTDNGIAYSAFATVGSIILAQPGQLAATVFLTTDCVGAGNSPTLGLWFNEDSTAPGAPAPAILSNFVNDPPQLAASATIKGRRYYVSQTGQPAWCRHVQIRFDWGTFNSPDEMLTYTIFGTVYEE